MLHGVLFGLLFALGLLLVQCGEVTGVCEDVVCDDDNACTEDACDPVDGACVFTALDDGTACTVDAEAGRCLQGACVAWCDGVECDDGNTCTDDVCDPADGSCSHPAVPDGSDCPLGEDPGRCASGVCVGLCEGVDCDDGNDCTEDLCDRGTGECTHPHRPDGAECDFGELPGVCESGVCVDAELCREVDCSDGNDCTDDLCDLVDASCSNPNRVDGAACEVDELPGECAEGVCIGLCEGVDCEDDNPCTMDGCDPVTGTCPHTPVKDGTECDFEGGPGVCQAGVCVSVCEIEPCDDGNDCTDDVCNPADGSCSHLNEDDGTACEIAGTAGECRRGVCGGIFDCTEEGIRAAITAGGGPHTFDCNGPTTVTTQAEIVIDNDVILDGEGNLSVSAPECGKWLGDPPLVLPCHRIFSVPSGITAELIGVRVANGCSKDGSGILNLGTLRLSRTSVRDNGWQHEWDEFCEYAPCGGRGGGIYNAGTLTLTDSSVSGNVTGTVSAAGGIYNDGTVTLIRSTVSHNTSGVAAAIWNAGSLTVLDSTVSHNRAEGLPCGVLCESGKILGGGSVLMISSTVSNNFIDCVNGGTVISGSGTLINSTISDNRIVPFYSRHVVWNGEVISSTIAGDCGAAEAYTHLIMGGAKLTNSVILNTALNPGPACPGPLESGGGNIESPGDSCGLSDPTDLVNVSLEELNLGPLQNNGGPTMTHALLTEPTVSVAIDMIPEAECLDADGEPLAIDQRGEERPVAILGPEPKCDVGAFEVQP